MGVPNSAIRAAALLVPLAFVLASADGANRGIVHPAGNRDSTSLTPAGDTDAFVVDLPSGAGLSVAVKADKGVPLQPALGLLRPDGSAVAAGELAAAKYAPGKTSVKLSSFPVDATGRWAIVASAHNAPQVGGYSLQTKVKYPKGEKVKGAVLPEGGHLDIVVPLAGGAVLSFALKRKSGGTGLAAPSLIQPGGFTAALPADSWTVSDKGIAMKPVAIAYVGTGDFTIRVPGPTAGGDAVVDYAVKVKFEKRKGISRAISPLEPVINTVSPEGGGFGTRVTAWGSQVQDGALLEVGGKPTTSVTRASDGTSIGGIVPTGSGTQDVTVINPDGQETTKPLSFTYYEPPVVTSITPARGPATGGTAVTVKGQNFRASMKVIFGGLQVLGPVVLVDAQTLTLVTEPAPAGLYTVEVKDFLTSQSGQLPSGFTFDRLFTTVTSGLPAVVEGARFSTAVLADLDRDTLAEDDLVAASSNLTSDGAGGYLPAARVLRGNNNRTFTDLTSSSFPGDFFPTLGSVPGTFNASRKDYGLASASAMGDLDGDGDQDLVLGVDGYFAPFNGWALTNPAYPKYSSYPFIPSPYLATDFYMIQYPGTRVLLNGGSGSFTNTTMSFDTTIRMAMPVLSQGIIWGENFQARALGLGDLDGDGDLDLVLATGGTFTAKQVVITGTYTYDVNTIEMPAVRMLANDGNGAFRFQTGLAVSGWSPLPAGEENYQATALAVADFDNDQLKDVAIVNNLAPSDGAGGKLYGVRLLQNGGAGGFTKKAFAFPAATALDDGRGTSIVAVDVNADQKLDLVVGTAAALETVDGGSGAVTRKSSTRVFRNNGDATFTETTATALPAATAAERWQAASLAAADLDKDGDADLVLCLDGAVSDGAGGYLPSTRILLNNGAGVFTPAAAGFVPAVDLDAPGNAKPRFHQAGWVRTGALDGDGDRDIVIGSDVPVTGVPGGGSRAPAVEVLQNR